MTEWLDAMRTDLDAEWDRAPRVATLATVDGVLAEARSVVVREVDDAGRLWFTSDRRSDKNAQLRANPSATLLFWLPRRRRQYRLAGTVEVIPVDDPRRRQHWEKLTDNARALFAWPPPGQPREAGAVFAPEVPAAASMPDAFEVLGLSPVRVESLDLTTAPHARVRWSRSPDGWVGLAVNP